MIRKTDRTNIILTECTCPNCKKSINLGKVNLTVDFNSREKALHFICGKCGSPILLWEGKAKTSRGTNEYSLCLYSKIPKIYESTGAAHVLRQYPKSDVVNSLKESGKYMQDDSTLNSRVKIPVTFKGHC